ncbi:MAG: NAD-dependent epimerase/dehydratase family protein [Alphaproteobacteria bacterium]|nr:NAD-dependent epimerase/dehydratase family protein [Alphaproteobacteria bacterium]
MTVLVTGAAGFIGYHLTRVLLERGEEVIGIDSLSPYYDVALKHERLARLSQKPAFSFHHMDVADRKALSGMGSSGRNIDRIVHLAAQPGVQHSLVAPHDYTAANVDGQLAVLELARSCKGLRHLVYASSSSVYGTNDTIPFSVDHRVDQPASLYAATKRAGELMASCYSHLYGIPATGLRFFTVYGPWGRPDMSPWIFTQALFDRQPLTVYNHGDLRRDFTWIDDIIAGILAALGKPPATSPPHTIYNLGNHRSESIMHLIHVLEEATGISADIRLAPLQPGDVRETCADIRDSRRDLGYEPSTSIDEGMPRFVDWFQDYHGYR